MNHAFSSHGLLAILFDDACLQIFLIGTAHVSKRSAEEVSIARGTPKPRSAHYTNAHPRHESSAALHVLMVHGTRITMIGVPYERGHQLAPAQVRDVIRMVKPDTVFVELCQERAEAIRRRASTSASADNGDFIRVGSVCWVPSFHFDGM